MVIELGTDNSQKITMVIELGTNNWQNCYDFWIRNGHRQN